MTNYFIMTDFGTQWFTALYKVNLENDNKQLIDFSPTVARTAFVSNLFSRGNYQEIRPGVSNDPCRYWAGWSISEFEYNRVKKLIELSKSVDEFEKLSKLN